MPTRVSPARAVVSCSRATSISMLQTTSTGCGELSSVERPKRRGSVVALLVDAAEYMIPDPPARARDFGARMTKLVLHPLSLKRFRWDCVVLLGMAYTGVLMPLQFASFDFIQGLGWLIVDQTLNCIFICDLFANMLTGYMSSKDRSYIMEAGASFNHYMRTWFFPDFISCIPYGLFALVLPGAKKQIWVFKGLRLLRAMRMLRLARIVSRIEMRSILSHSTHVMIKFGLFVAFTAHAMACVWYTMGDLIENPHGTWLDVEDRREMNHFDRYIASVYWALATMSTIGYGDIHATNTPERIFSMIVMVIGTGIYAYGITSVISNMSGVDQLQQKEMQAKDLLNAYTNQLNVPRDLRQELQVYLSHKAAAMMTFQEQQMLKMLSPMLRGKLSSQINAPLIRAVPFFKEAGELCIVEIVLLLEPRMFAPLEVIIEQGSMGLEMFIIKHGTIEVFLKLMKDDRTMHERSLAKLTDGAFFGEGALIPGQTKRGAYIRSVCHSLIYELCAKSVADILDRYPLVRDCIDTIAAERREVTATFKKPSKKVQGGSSGSGGGGGGGSCCGDGGAPINA